MYQIQLGTRFRISADTGCRLTANSGAAIFSIDEADGYLTFAADAAYESGSYRYQIVNADGDLVSSGMLRLLPSLISGDGRTPAMKALEMIDALIRGKASRDTVSVAVGDKRIQYMSIGELMQLRAIYAEEVESEQAAAGNSTDSYYARFTKP